MLFETVKASEERLRVQVGALRRDLARLDRFTEIVSISPAMRDVFRLMESAAASPITVLIEGETGTGKELVARGIHRTSVRADGPFIAVNCAAMAETLLESELFGHRKGAFTGAMQDRRGLFEAASGGTIFLDEVGEMPAPMQAKLLRVLQEGEVTPVGDERPRRVDVRVIAATNRDLAAEVKGGRFRQDLYYRIGGLSRSALPPLQRAPGGRPGARGALPRGCGGAPWQAGGRHRHPTVLDRLMAYSWPGNVRELQNEIERAVALCPDGARIGLELTSRETHRHTRRPQPGHRRARLGRRDGAAARGAARVRDPIPPERAARAGGERLPGGSGARAVAGDAPEEDEGVRAALVAALLIGVRTR